MAIDYTKLSDADLRAIAANDISSLSTEALRMIAGEEAAPKALPPSTERTWGQAIKDVPASLLTGAGSLLQAPGQLIKLVPGLKAAGEALEVPGEAVQKFGTDLKSAGLKAREALRSQAISDAEKEGILSEFATAITSTLKDPALITSFVAEQVPLLIGPLGAARLTTKLGMGAVEGAAAGAAREAAATKLGQRATTAAIGTGTAMQAADVSGDTYTNTLKRALEMGMSQPEAEDAALNAARIAAGGAAAVSLGANVGLAKLGGAAIERRLAGLPGKGRITSGVGEATSETLEEAGGQVFQNIGLRTVDPNQSLTAGVGSAAAMGALGGGFFGTMLGKKPETELAPGQRPGESLYDAAARINREIQTLNDLAKATETDQTRTQAGLMTNTQLVDMYREQGYGAVKQYQQQLLDQAADPNAAPEQKEAAKQAAKEIQDLFKQVSAEEVSRQTKAGVSNIITDKDVTINLGIPRKDPLYEQLVNKDLGKPEDAESVIQALETALTRKGLRQTQYERFNTALSFVNEYLATIPGSGFYAKPPVESTSGTSAGLAGVPGAGAATAGVAGAKPTGMVRPTEVVGQPAARKAAKPAPVKKVVSEEAPIEEAAAVQAPTAEKPAAPPAPAPAVTPSVSYLPKDLAGAKPRFAYGPKQFQLTFENDIGKALFITAQATPSKRDADYRAWLTTQGFDPEQIELGGKRIRERIKQLAKNADPEAGPISVPFVTKPVQGKFSLAPEVKDKLEPIYKRLEQRVKTAKPEAKPETKAEEAKEAPKEKTQKEALMERRAELVKELDGILKKILAKYNLTGVKLDLDEGMADEGSYSGQIIKLALNLENPVRVLRHESIHALKDMGFFSDAQWKTLVKKAQDEWVDKYLKNREHSATQSRYDAYVELLTKEGKTPTEVQEAIIEEAIADAFGDFDVNGAPAGLMAAIHRRMKNLFKAIKEAFGQAGIDTAEEIFGKIEKGSLKPAIPMGKEQAPKMSLAPKGIPQRIWDLHEKVLQTDLESTGEVTSRGLTPGGMKRNATMAFRRLNNAVLEFVGDDEKQSLALMQKMNVISGIRNAIESEDDSALKIYSVTNPEEYAQEVPGKEKFSLRVMRGEEKPEIEGKVTVDKVGQYFDDQIIETFGRKLDYSNEEDFNRAAQLALDEVRYQLKQNKSGLDWYEEDIKKAFKDTIKIIPNLKKEENRILFSVIAGIMSPQTNARDNWFIAAKAYQHYTDTKDIPGVNPETGGLWQGGTQSANKKVQLEFLDRMVKDLGQKDAVKWLLSDHTVKEINEFRSKYGNIKSGIEGKLGDVKPGLYAFGPKVGPFVSNLNGIHDVTVDKWMTRTFNRYFGTMVGPDGKIVDVPTEPQRRAVKKLINKVAEDAGIKPYQVQSVLWFYEQSLFSRLGTPAPSYGFSDGGRKFLESGGRGGEEGVGAPVGKAGEPVKKSLRGVVAEVAPNPDIPVAASWRQMTQAERLDATKSVAKKVIEPILSDMGLKGYSFKFSSGKYEGEVNPNILIEAPESATVAELEEVARVVGYILDQKAMVAYDEYNTDSGDQAGFVKVMIPAGMDDNTVTLLRNHISKEVPQADGDTLRDGALVYGNFSAYNDNVDTLSDEEYHDAIVRAIESFDYSETIKVSDPLKFHSQLVWPDNRESYLEGTRYGESGKIRGGEGSDVWRQGRSRLEAISEQAIALRDRWIDARGAARIGGRAGDSAAISTEPTAEYGRAIDGSESAVGVHFSQQPRSTLDSQFYGAGLRGMERERLEGQPDIRNRIYFYVDTGKGVFPEAGVGGSPHVIRLNNLYNALKDELGLVKTAKGDTVAERATAWEKAIKKAGFDGYFFPDPLQRQGYAVLIGKHRVETKLSLRSQTPEFKFWFGQSKIVDKDGKPKVMYHGTGKDYTIIGTGRRQAKAIFVTDDPEFAQKFAIDTYNRAAVEAAKGVGMSDEAYQRGVNKAIAAVKKDFKNLPEGKAMIEGIRKGYDKANPEAQEYMRNAFRDELPAGPNILPIFVKAEFPFDYDNKDHVDQVVNLLNKNFDSYGRKLGDKEAGDLRRGDWETIEKDRIQKAIIDLGFDGFYVKEGGRKSLAVYSPNQIVSATGNVGAYGQRPITAEEAERFGMTEEEAAEAQKRGDIRFSLRSPIGLYSELENKVEAVSSKAAPAGQWKTMIAAMTQKGVKPEEIEWSGVNDWLDLQSGKVAKDDLLEYLRANGVQVEETVLGKLSGPQWSAEANRIARRDYGRDYGELDHDEQVSIERDIENDNTKYGQYTLPGGENYREVLLTLPTKVDAETKRLLDEERYLVLTPEQQAKVDAAKNKADIRYRSSHWDQPNVVAHIRVNDRVDADGNRVLFVEEIQSDWGQTGKKRGFAPQNVEAQLKESEERMRRRGEEIRRLSDRMAALTDNELDEFNRLADERQRLQDEQGVEIDFGNRLYDARASGIPIAPFVGKTEGWLNLALKRIMIMAAEGGYDKVAFVNGDQSADRYDLSKQVKYIQWNTGASPNSKLVTLEMSDGKEIGLTVRDGVVEDSSIGADGKPLEDVVGKEIANKIIAEENGDLRGLDLKVGGEGMKAFYDKIVPTTLKKLLPKVGGGQMETVDIAKGFGHRFKATLYNGQSREFDSSDAAYSWVDRDHGGAGRVESLEVGLPQPGFDITPAMKEKVETTGLPKFSLRSTLPASAINAMDKIAPPRYKPGFAERIMNAVTGDTFTSIRQKLVNRYERLAEYDRRAAKLLKQMGGAQQLASSRAETAALMSDLGAGVLEAAMGVHDRIGGAPIFRNGVTTVSNYGGTVKGLLEIFKPIAAMKDADAFRMYQTWAAVKRGKRLDVEGREELITPAQIRAIDDLRRSNPDLIKTFEKVQKDWLAYNNALVKYQVATGVLTPEMAREWTKHGDYFPFYRLMDGEDIAGPKTFSSIGNVSIGKKLKGGEDPLGDFFENIVRNSQAAIQAGMKNVAAQAATKQALLLNEVTRLNRKPQSSEPVYRVYENGREVYYRSHDPLFIEAIKALNMADIPFMGLLAKPAAVLRNLVTKDPAFMLANMMRDSLSAWATTGIKMTPVIDTLSNFGKAIAGKSPELDALYSAGVLGGYDYARGSKQAAEVFETTLRRRSGKMTAFEVGTKPFTSVWEALEKGTQASDAATRMEVYKKTLAATGNELEALSAALEVMNFNRKGNSAVIRILTAAVPFLNARIQGLDVLYRTAIMPLGGNATDQAKQRMKTFWVRGMTIMALSSMYWLLTHDDDEYKKQEQETRDNYWLIPSLGVKIPIPFEVGVMFKVIPERIMQLSFGTDTSKDFTDSMKRQLVGTFAFNPIPQVILPLYEVKTNYSFFTDRPIIGKGLENVVDKYQVGPSTSRVAQMIGDSVGFSPMKTDYLIKGYFGTIGSYASDLFDMMYDMTSDSPKASKRFEQLPVVKRFALDPEARGTVTAYYKLKDEVDQAVRTSNLLERSNNFSEQSKYTLENLRLLATDDYIKDVEKDMKDYREKKQQIMSMPLSADTKRDLITNISRMESLTTRNIQNIKKFAQ